MSSSDDHRTQRNLKLDEQLQAVTGTIAERATSIVSGSASVLTTIFITLFVLFFLYRDGEEALNTFRRLLPLSDEEKDQLLERMNDSMLGTMNGSFIVSLFQAVLAGIIYTSLGVPGALLWSFATFLAALIPALETFFIWGPITLYLALSGSSTEALLLLGFGALAIGGIDNVLYPYLVGDRVRMHTVPTLFAILGGVFVFGIAGLILGPVILSGTTVLLDIWWQRTRSGNSAESVVAEKEGDDLIAPAEFLEIKSA